MRTQMNGYVVPDDDAETYRFFGFGVVSPRDVRQAIADNPEGETLTLEVNSGGGNMFAGYEIYTILKAATIPTEVEIQSLAGSAMSVAAIGADVVRASPVAQFMIHLPSLRTEGDSVEHKRSLQALNSFKASVLNAYELKCAGKKTRSELDAMLRAETWLPVQDAVAAGFVDEVLYDDEGVIAAQAVMCAQTGIRALATAGGLPDIAELRARRAAMEPGKPPEKTPQDSGDALALAKAKLALLKNK